MRAALAGSLLAFVLDALMLSGGHVSFWRSAGLLSSFYDLQGRALLHGHLAVPNGSASFEGFVIDGHTYVYFGLVPSLFRLPFLAVTHGLDGRMTQLSMLAGFVVLLLAGAKLHWRVREFMRPGAPVSRAGRAAAFLVALALGAGAVPLFLASWPVIYHEAELWGAAFSIAGICAVLAVVQEPSTRRIAWAGLLALLAVNTRVSVGLGPTLALLIVAIAVAAHGRVHVLTLFGPREVARPLRTAALIGAAAAIALGSAVAVNEARFHSAFSIPLDKQVDTQIDPTQRAFVAAYHGAATGLRFLPTTLLATVRPDAIGTTRAFPFIGLPSSPPTVIGSVRFNALLPQLSAFTSMPLFCVLLVLGIPGLLRTKRAYPLLGALIATGAAFAPALLFGSTATRYLADLLPFLFLGACIGVHAPSRLRERVMGSARLRRLSLAAAGILVVVAIAVNGSVGLVEQRLIAPSTSAATRASFVSAQDAIDRFLGRSPRGVHAGAAVPTRALGPVGDLFVLGRCDGLYVESFGGTWLPVERSAGAGLFDLAVHFPPTWTGFAPLLSIGSVTLGATPTSDGRVVFSVRVAGRPIISSAAVAVGSEARISASIDRLGGAWFLSVDVPHAGGVLHVLIPYDPAARAAFGVDRSDPHSPRFPGSVSEVPEPTPVCDRIARRAGLL